MRAAAVGLLVEEQRVEIAAAWKSAVDRELGGEPAIGFAVGPLLRELSLALRGDGLPGGLGAPRPAEQRSAGPHPGSRIPGASGPGSGSRGRPDGPARCAVLVRSGADASRVVREWGLLHHTLWRVLREAGCAVAASDRCAVDEWLHEALAIAVERIERQQRRIELLERGPAIVPGRAPALAPPSARPAPARPPGLGPTRPPPLPRAVRPPPLPAGWPDVTHH